MHSFQIEPVFKTYPLRADEIKKGQIVRSNVTGEIYLRTGDYLLVNLSHFSNTSEDIYSTSDYMLWGARFQALPKGAVITLTVED